MKKKIIIGVVILVIVAIVVGLVVARKNNKVNRYILNNCNNCMNSNISKKQ